MEFSHSYIAEYVKRAQTGDSDAFAELYNLTYKKVLNFAYYYFHDEFLAQDAMQEVYVSAFKNINSLKDPTLFSAWIKKIAFNVCYDMAKSRKDDYGDVDDEFIEEISDGKLENNPEESALDTDEKIRLREAIDKLTESERQLVILRFFNQMTIEEIVDATGISRSTVKRQLASVVVRLKILMKE